MNGDRLNGFGPRISEHRKAFGRAVAATRAQAEVDGAAAGFTTTPATPQWSCPCGGVNPTSRTKCRFCGEPHACGDGCPCGGTTS